MAGLNEIIALCKSGQVLEAYSQAKADLEQGMPWAKLTTGKALYYCIRKDAEEGRYEELIVHLDELMALEQLTPENENTIFWIGYFAKKHLSPTAIDTPKRLSALFSRLKPFSFKPGISYSALLEGFTRHDSWLELDDFMEWWNLQNLTPEDYLPLEVVPGRKILSVAERAYIAKSKVLLRLNDRERIEEFLPRMEKLMENHTEMLYLGYFYGKLLLSMGRNTTEALNAVIPFARKKSTEFWVWQLLSDVFVNEPDKHLACLLRAVHCRTQEKFLGKVRIKLAQIYIQRNQLGLAKYQIDKVTQCYLPQGWHLPYEVECWIHQPWINNVASSNHPPVDFQTITDEIIGSKIVEGIVVKRPDKEFAFLKTEKGDYYISPKIVDRNQLSNSEKVKSLVVYEYNKKRKSKEWICVKIMKK